MQHPKREPSFPDTELPTSMRVLQLLTQARRSLEASRQRRAERARLREENGAKRKSGDS
jgi:hypothetical protein